MRSILTGAAIFAAVLAVNAAEAAIIVGVDGDNIPTLTYYASTGQLKLDSEGLNLEGIIITSSSAKLTGTATLPAGGAFPTNTTAELSSFAFGTGFGLDLQHNFGNALLVTIPESTLRADLTFQYSNVGGSSSGNGDLIFVSVPEPATFGLFGAAAMLLGTRRRK